MTAPDIEAVYPAFPGQTSLLEDRPSPAFRCGHLRLEVEGALDADLFDRAWQAVVDAYAALRIGLAWRRVERPLQVVRRTVPAVIERHDWTASAAVERGTRVRALLATAAASLDASRPPLVRLFLCREAEERHLLVAAYHPCLFDDDSVEFLLGRALAAHDALGAGRAPDLPACRFRDYVAWLKSQDLAAEERFWRQRNETWAATPALSEAACAATGEGDWLRERPLDEAVAERLAAGGEAWLAAGWALAVGRYSGRRQVVVGWVASGRPEGVARPLVGPFTSVLPLAVRLPREARVAEWLAEVAASQLEIGRSPVASARRIPTWWGVEDGAWPETAVRRRGPAPERPRSTGLRVRGAGEGGLPAPLVLELAADRRLLRLHAEDAPFGPEIGGELLELTAEMLVAVEGKRRDRLGQLPALPARAARRLAQWNATGGEEPGRTSVPALFAERVAAAPEATAVDFERVLTYRQLDRESNRLAHHLRAAGVAAGDPVAICLPRTSELVVALLAVLKAGAFYLPLDPTFPRERLALMVEDARARVILTVTELRGSCPAGPARVIELDREATAVADRADTDPAVQVPPEAAAYLIYTSGSTGRPKGVVVPHRAIVGLVRDTDYVSLGPSDRVAHASNASFDAATFELWGPLLNGGTVVAAGADVVLAPELLGGWLRERRITALFLTTALFNQVAARAPDAFAGLAHLLFGGEAVDAGRVREVLLGGGPARLLHVYGPTETTTFASWFPVEGVAEGAATLPIGRPIAHARIHVVDGWLDPVPFGVRGEVVIAGQGLAWGYLGRPGLTAERFVPDPHATRPGGRLYRTGDVARRRADGDLEFIGRSDHQVKLRGFRIELGEVEAALTRQPDVSEAIAIVREDRPGDRRLVAYVSGRRGAEPRPASLAAALREVLPEFMVPAAIVPLAALPLNANGKIDRRALPPPPEEAVDELPRGDLEQVVAAIWSEVLGRERVGRHDDFFLLGGHSLMATQVVSRVRESFQVELPLRRLFENATVAGLANAVEEALRAGQALPVPPLVPQPRGGRVPLSFAQQRLWFLHQLEPDSPAYAMPVAFRLRGRLSTAAFSAAFGELVRRHESLRTVFPAERGEPRQWVLPPSAVPLPLVDLRRLDEPDRRRQVRRLTAAEARRPFDLERGPVLRVRVLTMEEDDHAILLTLHHVASDGWSMGILVGEIAALYRAYGAGTPSPLQELPVQYSDFAAWQRGWLADEVLERELSYWRGRLSGTPPLLELPTDRPRPPAQRYRGAAVTVELPAGIVGELRRLGRRAGATDFMTLLAAFQLLLSRWSGQPTVVVGTPIAGRDRLELEGLIGFFVNTLALRADVARTQAFSPLLVSTRDTVLDAYLHQHLPFERLVDELDPQRSLSHSPIFQVLFSLQNAPLPDVSLPQAELSSLGVGGEAAQFDLSLDVGERPEGGFALSATYDVDLFDRSTVLRLLDSFRAVADGVVTHPERPVGELPLLSPAQRHQVVTEWNDTLMPGLAERGWLGDFAERVRERPEAVAATCGDREVTFAQLDARAGRIAAALVDAGAGPETIVPVLCERGIELVGALVGVLMAGAAYMPLDPKHPPARLAQLLAAARTPVALSTQETLPLLRQAAAALPQPERLHLSTIEEAQAGERRLHPAVRPVDGRHLAYVLFTSGSTGVPKGPMITRWGLANHLWTLVRELDLGADDRVAQNASQCFDVSVWQLLGALLVGGRVVVLPDAVAHDPARLLDDVERQQITVLEVVPSLLRGLLDAAAARPEPPRLPRLRWLIPTGEELPPDLARRWLRAFPAVPLLNAYGPAECSDDVSWSRIDRLPPNGSPPRVALGRSLPNLALYAVDATLRVLPVGVVGELCVGGVAVGRGYLGDPRRTAASFVPDPFGADPGGRLYRSGDLVRWRPDGELEYRGRLDQQVKIRGQRVEPGEVEAALVAHPGVAEGAVVVRQASGGEPRLVAFVVPAAGELPTPAELRADLSETLPAYMVPSQFVSLAALPRNANGKLDRNALPAPEPAAAGGGEGGPPRTPVEQVTAGIWGAVLGLDEVGRDDDFFALGGHSLLATRVLSRLRQAFEVELPLRVLFEASRLGALAQRVERARRERYGRSQPALVRSPRLGPLPLSYAQERLWYQHRLDPESAAYNMPVAYRFDGPLSVAALEEALAELERRHEVLRTGYSEVDGLPVQIPRAPEIARQPVVDLSGLPRRVGLEAVRRLLREESARPFDLERGPVLRALLLRLAGDEHRVSLCVHHVACDGWSLDVLAREVAALYGVFAAGRPSPLPDPEIQYADFAAWQRAWLTGEALDEHVAFWRRHLAGAPPVLDLPFDRDPPPVPTSRGALHSFRLPAELAGALRLLSREEEATLFLVVFAAFAAALHRWSGQEDLVIGTDVAGRDRVETEGLIGFFISNLPLRADLSGNPTFREMVRRVRHGALEAWSHQELPFHLLVEKAQVVRVAGRNPVFQVSYVHQNVPATALRMSDVVAQPVEPEHTASPFDLTLATQEADDGSLSGLLRYRTDLWEAETVARWAKDLETILADVAAGPETRLAALAGPGGGRAPRRSPVRAGGTHIGRAGVRRHRSLAPETSP